MFIVSFCLETYLQQSDDYKVLAKNSGVKECYKIIEAESDELIHVNPGDKVLGARLIGLPPIPVGINEAEGTILITYTKPCHGTAAIELPVDKEELISIRKMDIGAEEVVKFQLDAGLDIVGDGQPRGDMVGSFVSHIPGFSYEMNSSVIVDKIKTPLEYIVLPDLKYAMAVLDKELDKRNLPAEERAKKGVKGIVTGPSTIVHSSRIESFYKDRNPAIIDTAHALRKEIEAINESGAKYIQIDEPFLSTGMVDIGTAKEAISILSEDIDIPVAMHVSVDEEDQVRALVERGINAIGVENMFLDPDCGLRKVDLPIAERKIKIMTDLAKELE